MNQPQDNTPEVETALERIARIRHRTGGLDKDGQEDKNWLCDFARDLERSLREAREELQRESDNHGHTCEALRTAEHETEKAEQQLAEAQKLYSEQVIISKNLGDGMDALAADARRFKGLQNMDRVKAQAFFWQYESRKQRAAAIDAALEQK